MHTNALCQKLDKVIAVVLLCSIIHIFSGQGIKPPGVMPSLSEGGGLPCKILPWRVMVSAAVYAVAFANVVGKGLASLGVYVKFKASAAMVAARAGVTAVSACVGL